MKSAMAVIEPLSSISLPKSAPSRNSGKNCARKRAAPFMKVWVQWASTGSPAKSAATTSAKRRQQQHAPAPEGEPDQQPEPNQNAEKPHPSDPFQQDIEIERRAAAEIVAMGVQEMHRRTCAPRRAAWSENPIPH